MSLWDSFVPLTLKGSVMWCTEQKTRSQRFESSTFTSCCSKTVIQPLWISVFSSFRWKQESQICGVLSNGYNKNDNIIFVGVTTIAVVVRLLINFDRGIKGPRQSPEWSPELLWPALLAPEAVGSPRGLGLPWAICDLGDMCLLLAARPRP